MDLTNSSLVPFLKFKAQFINSRAFIGRCSLRDVSHFLFIHRDGFRYVLWIDYISRRMCVSFCSYDMFHEQLEIHLIEIVFPVLLSRDDNLTYDIIYNGVSLDDPMRTSCRIYFYHWFPSEISTLNSLFVKIFELINDKLKNYLNLMYSVNISRQCLFSNCIPYDKRRHECQKYENCDLNSYQRCFNQKYHLESLKEMCLFFIANYFKIYSGMVQSLPRSLINEIENVQPCIGETDKLKNKKMIIQTNFYSVVYKNVRLDYI